MIKRELKEAGIEFSIYKEDDNSKEKLNFPILYTDYFDLKNLVKKSFYLSLQLLEDLWNGGELKELKDGSYLIKIESIYQFKDELTRFLDFEADDNLEVKIKAELPVGSRNFSLSYQLHHSEYGYLSNFYDRQGIFFPINNKRAILLSKTLVNLLKLVEKTPVMRNEQLTYVAKVKSLARKAGANFDGYLENEEYYFPEELDVKVEEKGIDHLELEPLFNDLDEELNVEAAKFLKKDNSYGVKKDIDGKNRRIFFSDDKKKDYQQVRNNKEIKGVDVPKLVENPAYFLPESVDLEKFSERVKGLKENVYQAQPYVRSKDSDEMDWLEIDTGVELKQEAESIASETDEDELKTEMNVDEFDELVKKARQQGEGYVLWQGNWIKIPDSSEDFINSTKEIEKIKQNGKVRNSDLPYIFDIYDNVDRLEYNLELLDQKEKLRKAGLIEYQRPNLLSNEYELYSYQKDGYRWLNYLQFASLGGLLADDMGLGKTVQVIALMAKLKEDNELIPSLVVAPSSLLENWWSEIEEFCPAISNIYLHRGSSRAKNSQIIKKADVVLTTYQTLVRDQIILGEIDWQLMVCDEVQNIKNKSTLSANAVKAQKAELRLALTGTPVENGLSDLWSIVDYIQPGLLGSYKSFNKEFIKPIQKINNSEELASYEQELKTKIHPVYLRRTKDGELKSELPEKKERELRVEMSNKQQELYNKIRLNYQENENQTYLKTLQDLLKVSLHPGLIEGDWERKSADLLINEGPKLKKMVDILKEIRSKGEKALIFTLYREMQYIIQRVIREKFGLDLIPIINGSSRNRVRIVDTFNTKTGFACMILSLKAAGVGLNITGANHVIHYRRWWNPAVEDQATDRAYRIGQEKDVIVYYPITTMPNLETIEEKLNRLLKEKRGLAKSIIVPNKQLEKEIKSELL